MYELSVMMMIERLGEDPMMMSVVIDGWVVVIRWVGDLSGDGSYGTDGVRWLSVISRDGWWWYDGRVVYGDKCRVVRELNGMDLV